MRKFKCKEIECFNISQGGFCTRGNVSCLSGSLLTNRNNFVCVMELYTVMSEYLFSVENMVRYMKKLKRGNAPGCDGVSSEHLKFAINTSLPQYLSDILTVSDKIR